MSGLLRRHRGDLLSLLILVILPVLWFAPVLFPALTGRTLLPYDNLYSFEPFRSMQPGLVPHNELLSDLVLENAVWKLHIRRTLAEGQLPLWNPKIFTGLPFLAAGQASTFYPLSIIFYVLPLELAYGWFTALQIALAGVNTYLLARVLRLRPLPALLGGVVFMFSGFLIVSVVFTMFLAAAVWLPLVLAIIEIMVRKQEDKGVAAYSPIPYVTAGAIAIGLMVLGGHPELIYYTMLVSGAFALIRLISAWRILRRTEEANQAAKRFSAAARIAVLGVWLLAMAVLGIGLGAVQLVPLLELLPQNFRAGSVSYDQVVGWAWPLRHLLTFGFPDVFGNPSHHRWYDIWSHMWVPATANALGEPTNTIFWGIKNYVEGGDYLSIAAWLLAAVAVAAGSIRILFGRGRRSAATHGALSQPAPRPVHLWFFAALAPVSLLFAFGTPFYAILFYGLPGWDQLHSPFRWVFPFTLAMAVLAAMGMHELTNVQYWRTESRVFGRLRLAVLAIVSTVALAGAAALVVVAASLFNPDQFIALGQRIVDGSDLARAAFAGGRMFWSYQVMNLLRFGVFSLLAAGLLYLLYLGMRRRDDARGMSTIPYAATALILLIFVDLFVAHGRFNPAAPVDLSPMNPESTPPSVRFLNERMQAGADGLAPWRFTTFDAPGEKTFNANSGMYFDWQDIRGYDSTIPAQYVALMERIAPQSDELLYNKIAPLYAQQGGDVYASLDNPLLDLLNVRYVLTEHYIPNPKWREIYRDESIGIYENQNVLPRAFVVPEARVAPAADQPLLETDLGQTVFIEEPPAEEHALAPSAPQVADANISRYTSNDVFVDVNLSDRGWLILADAYFPGWKAFIRPFGAPENQEQELTLYRADGALRAVYLPEAGQWTVRFVYTPMSFKLGLYISFLSGMALLLLVLYWLWGRFYRPERTEGEVRTVAKNSLVPMGLSLTNKAVDFAFAMLYVRILGPAGTGSYAFVIAFYGFFEIISRYGLGTLLTRDVAADKNQSSRYLTNVLGLRTLLWLVSLPVMALVAFGFWAVGQVTFLDASGIGRQELIAIGIFAISMIFANWSDAFSSMFLAFEKMEYPAGLANAMAMLKVSLGALVLLLGYGYVGLAGTSLVVNVLALIWLYFLMRVTLFKPEWKWDWSLQQRMLRTSGPLMINHLLATIFWRIDVWILRPLAGAFSVGLYSVGLKYLDGLNIIPSVFTMAIFPLMSRYAKGERESLRRAYHIALRLLLIVSLPMAAGVTFLATPLVWLVGGAQYLNIPLELTAFGKTLVVDGGSNLALQILIWSIPIGFVNSVTQYLLISVNQQHFLTRAFLMGVTFNVVGNLIAIPRFGYAGAAVVTILSEFSLLFPFYYSVRRNVGAVPWLRIVAPPVGATGLMILATVLLQRVGAGLWLAVTLGAVVYLFALAPLGAFRGEDMAFVLQKLPLGPFKRFTERRAGT